MSSLIVPIAAIDAVMPHPNADRLEIAVIKGWQVIVSKGTYQPGDRVIYVPPDAVVPLAWSDQWNVTRYLQKGRVRCARLRGEPSFGFTAPITDLPADHGDWQLDDNVADVFGITKYEPPFTAYAEDAVRAHPLFVKYTEIENLRHFPDVLQPGEEVILTEKIHGCLDYRTRVTMADHTTKRIMNIVPGDLVLGVDEFGAVVPTAVHQKFNNGTADRWLTIRGKRRAVGRGSNFFAVHCTPNHRFWVPGRGYVEAGDLAANMPITMLRSERGLTPIQEQVLLGKLLGDGYLHIAASGSASVAFGHKVEHAAYVDWTAGALGDLGTETREKQLSGYGTVMVRARSVFSWHIAQTFGEFRTGEHKRIPPWVAEKLGPISMAFWYMDDGSLSHHDDQEDRALIATNGFTFEDCAVLQAGLKRFGIESVIYESSGFRLRLNADAAERLFLLIAPYVPPSMQYKLPVRYRGGPGWMPAGAARYKPMLVDLVIDSVEENQKIQSARWDIETGTHNFFANGVLVHNSNVRIGSIEGEIMAGSHRVRRRRPVDLRSSLYWFPVSIPGVESLVTALGAEHRQVILFGEVYGRVQSLRYGIEDGLDFRAFDLLVDGKYLDWDDFKGHCAQHDVPVVPEIHRGAFSLDEIKARSEGQTLVGGTHYREGVVVHPVVERHDDRVDRVILKYASDTFLLGGKDEPVSGVDA